MSRNNNFREIHCTRELNLPSNPIRCACAPAPLLTALHPTPRPVEHATNFAAAAPGIGAQIASGAAFVVAPTMYRAYLVPDAPGHDLLHAVTANAPHAIAAIPNAASLALQLQYEDTIRTREIWQQEREQERHEEKVRVCKAEAEEKLKPFIEQIRSGNLDGSHYSYTNEIIRGVREGAAQGLTYTEAYNKWYNAGRQQWLQTREGLKYTFDELQLRRTESSKSHDKYLNEAKEKFKDHQQKAHPGQMHKFLKCCEHEENILMHYLQCFYSGKHYNDYVRPKDERWKKYDDYNMVKLLAHWLEDPQLLQNWHQDQQDQLRTWNVWKAPEFDPQDPQFRIMMENQELWTIGMTRADYDKDQTCDIM
jgi:hypothetical protein